MSDSSPVCWTIEADRQEPNRSHNMEAFATQKLMMLVICTIVISLVLAHAIRRCFRRTLHLPPGPRPWPVLGNLPHVGKIAHQSLSELSNQYGPLMLLWMGSYPTVIVSSPEMASEFLKSNGEVFASRPHSLGGEILAYNQQSLAQASYGSAFHLLRRSCMELLSATRVLQFKDIRREEICGLVLDILEESKDGKPVFIREKLFALTNNNITRMLFNKSFYRLAATTNAMKDTNSDDFKVLVNSTIELGLSFFIGNYIPCLNRLDLGRLRAKMWNIRAKWDKFLNEIIDQHRVTNRFHDQDGMKDFVDVLLSVQKGQSGKDLSDERIVALLKDMLLGGNDTSATQTAWTLMELMRNPEVRNKLQKELDTVVGIHRPVDESDLPNLPYLRAVVKESFRLRPVLPLLLPHESSNLQPIKIAGYDIPAGTRLMVNVYAIQRDPSLWEDPLKFVPERFMNSPVDFKGHHFELLPFGSGRRACPGMNVAVLLMELTLAQLLHSCDLSLPEGLKPEDLDDIDEFRGLLYPKSIPLHFSSRLPSSVYASFKS